MKRRLSGEEINRQTVDEVRALTPEEKFEQLEILFASAPHAPQSAAEEEDIQRVRELWMRLHAYYQR